MNFHECLKIIFAHENGYVNDLDDPGGMTNMGVTEKTWKEWDIAQNGRDRNKKVTEDEMRGLTKDDVAPIYKNWYWDRVKGENWPSGLDLCVFDFGVNAGTGRAVKFLQKIVGAAPDGLVGNRTLAKIEECEKKSGIQQLIKDYGKERLAYYEKISKGNPKYLEGWKKRTTQTEELALKNIIK